MKIKIREVTQLRQQVDAMSMANKCRQHINLSRFNALTPKEKQSFIFSAWCLAKGVHRLLINLEAVALEIEVSQSNEG